MKIGTLSFELKGQSMAISGIDRIGIITEITKDYNLDFMLCSGYSLENNQNLLELVKRLKKQSNKTTILVEVKNDIDIQNNGHPVNTILPKYITSTHKMFIIDSENEIKELGAQYFATSGELNTKPNNKILISMFESHFKNRIFKIGEYRAVALCCGELNIFKGRSNIVCRSAKIKRIIDCVDIVVNPTHDGMANYGTLNAKRRYLSKKLNGKNRCYISSSNWNTGKKRSNGKIICQNKSGASIQSIFLNGNNQKLTRYIDKDYEFRTTTITL